MEYDGQMNEGNQNPLDLNSNASRSLATRWARLIRSNELDRLVIDGKAVPSTIRKRIAACNMSDTPNSPHYCTCTLQEETLAEEPHLTQHLAQSEYLVSPEDTLSSVANRFGIDADTLFELNHELLSLGRVLGAS